jgi:2-isopropylmalate synthase
MRTENKLELPRRLQIEFSQVIQQHTEEDGGEVTAAQMWEFFQDEYLPNATSPWGRFKLKTVAVDSDVDGDTRVKVSMTDRTTGDVDVEGLGNGPIAAFCNAMVQVGVDVRVLDYHEHAMSSGGDAQAASYVECAVAGQILWGVGIDSSIVTSSLKAVVSAVNRAQREQEKSND